MKLENEKAKETTIVFNASGKGVKQTEVVGAFKCKNDVIFKKGQMTPYQLTAYYFYHHSIEITHVGDKRGYHIFQLKYNNDENTNGNRP